MNVSSQQAIVRRPGTLRAIPQHSREEIAVGRRSTATEQKGIEAKSFRRRLPIREPATQLFRRQLRGDAADLRVGGLREFQEGIASYFGVGVFQVIEKEG